MIFQDPHPRAYANKTVHGPMGSWLGTIRAALMIATAWGVLSVALAASTTPAQPQEMAQEPEAAPARPPSAAPSAAPKGMVPYNKPKFSNGRLILWHGAWRHQTSSNAPHKPARLAEPAPAAADLAPIKSQHLLNGIRPVKSVCEWNDVKWDDMSAAEQKAWRTLGWRREIWGSDDQSAEPAVSAADWEDLTASQKHAARVLGYEKGNWNVEPDPCEGE
jgi:hypothetical protein